MYWTPEMRYFNTEFPCPLWIPAAEREKSLYVVAPTNFDTNRGKVAGDVDLRLAERLLRPSLEGLGMAHSDHLIPCGRFEKTLDSALPARCQYSAPPTRTVTIQRFMHDARRLSTN
jgi:hypothetical protein